MMDQLHDWHQDNNTAHWTDCKSHVFIHVKLKIASTWGLICNPRLMDAQKQLRLKVIGFNLHFIHWFKKRLISTFVIFFYKLMILHSKKTKKKAHVVLLASAIYVNLYSACNLSHLDK